jgi:3-oxoacyl-[acyl-carrier-protein] synthase II
VGIRQSFSIKGLGALSALGVDLPSHLDSIAKGVVPFRPLGDLLGATSVHAATLGAWIADRECLTSRKWGPATMAALHAAREAIAEAGWSKSDLKDAALVVGTSRGNAAGWLGPWPGRRPFRLMAASNTIHSEPASAISIEFGITGPNHVVASGCAAGLDAVGLAMMMLQCGLATRALAVAVDLPLVPMLLDQYASSGLLSKSANLDPYHTSTTGFVPAEAAAAMAIESGEGNHPRLLHYACNSDAANPVGIPADGGRSAELFHHEFTRGLSALCPHATGTLVQAVADPTWMQRAFSDAKPPLILLKPYVGHAIGASGMLESAILAGFMKGRRLPGNVKGLSVPQGFVAPHDSFEVIGPVAKVSNGMGGHNAILVISPASE